MFAKRKPGRRLLYPVGLISLILFPVLCLLFLRQHHVFDQLRTLEIILLDPRDIDDGFITFNPIKFDKRNFMKIVLNGGPADEVKLEYFQILIQEMKVKKDSTLGAEVSFTNKTTYSSIVRLHDICKIEKIQNYVQHQDKFWAFNFVPKPKPTSTGHYMRNYVYLFHISFH